MVFGAACFHFRAGNHSAWEGTSCLDLLSWTKSSFVDNLIQISSCEIICGCDGERKVCITCENFSKIIVEINYLDFRSR